MAVIPRWTPQQLDAIGHNANLTDRELAALVNTLGPRRSLQAVKSRRQHSGIAKLPTVWSDDGVVARMTKLYGQGFSASQIARTLNDEFKLALSCNAVIGKIHRLGAVNPELIKANRAITGIERRVKVKRPPPPPKAARQFHHGSGCVIAMIPKAAAPIRIAGPLPGSLNLPMGDEAFGGCRYPTSGEHEPEILFCCLPAEDASYCPGHASICGAPVPASGRKSAKELIRSLRRYVA